MLFLRGMTMFIYVEGSSRPGADLAVGGKWRLHRGPTGALLSLRTAVNGAVMYKWVETSAYLAAIRLQSECAVPAFALKQQYAMCLRSCSFLGQ
jgi:hypothetical protein